MLGEADEQEIPGSIDVVGPYPDEDRGGQPTIFIRGIHVEAGWTGLGYGSRLLAEVLEEADEIGAAVELEVASYDHEALDNDALRAWYLRRGFQPLDQPNEYREMLRREPRRQGDG